MMVVPAPVPLTSADVATALAAAGVARGELVGLAVGGTAAVLATADAEFSVTVADLAATLAAAEAVLRPRWVVWDEATTRALVASGARLATCWHLAAVHRLLAGGWRAEPARLWAWLHGLDHRSAPSLGQMNLLAEPQRATGEGPVQDDGHLAPEWVAGGWRADPRATGEWARLGLAAAHLQLDRVEAGGQPRHLATAHAESTAELLCAELAADGLPVDLAAAHTVLHELIGPRPANEAEAAAERARRDEQVLRHFPAGHGLDLRNPASVRTMLRRAGIDVPDTRAWRLKAMRDEHPLVDDLLRWRKAERVVTTFGYGWLDQFVGPDGRLRGEWSASDGAAGRMTAGAGLHNLPAELRPMVCAEPGHLFVRADLGQIEPRVLAAVSADPALRTATAEDDLYLPVARRLGVERPVAKVAVLAAMYGQTSGTAGQALRGMEQAYPVAMRYLADAAKAGEEGREVRTFGGRLIRMYEIDEVADYRAAAAARGRYSRNAMVQGAAAELFKMWAVTFRARTRGTATRIVLCLHDELLIHAPEAEAPAVVALLQECLAEAAHRWHPTSGVRFVADVSTVRSWADAKA